YSLPVAAGWWAQNIHAVDANTYSAGSTSTVQLATPRSGWDKSYVATIFIYTIDHPDEGERYCEIPVDVDAKNTSSGWSINFSPIDDDDVDCRHFDQIYPESPAPLSPLTRLIWGEDTSLTPKVMSKSNSDYLAYTDLKKYFVDNTPYGYYYGYLSGGLLAS